MNRLALFVAGGALALWLCGPAASGKDDDKDPAARDWNQARGNYGRSGRNAVEPLAGEPVEAWKQQLPGAALAEPVTWGGVVYVAAADGKGRKLLAFRAATGEPLATRDLGAGGRLSLGTWQGVVIVGEPQQIRGVPLQGGKFGGGWSQRGSFGGPPCVYRGTVIACDGAELVVMDALTGSRKAKGPVVDVNVSKDAKGVVGGAAAVMSGADATYIVNVATMDTNAYLTKSKLDDLAPGRTPLVRYPMSELVGVFPGAIPEGDRWDMVPCRMDGDGPGKGAWALVAPRPFKDGGEGRIIPDSAKSQPAQFIAQPAVVGGAACGSARNGDVVSWNPDGGKSGTVVPNANRPQGAKTVAPAGAGGVLYLGNWAVEPDGNRIIWTVKHEPATTVIPAGDRRVVFADTKNHLVSLADAAAIAEAASGAAAGGGAAGQEAVAQKEPGDADGVLLEDGRFIEGAFEESKQKVTVRPRDGGESVTSDVADVVVAQKGGAAELRGDDAAALRIWKAALAAQFCDAVEPVFQEYAKSNLVNEARALMQKMRDNGASEVRLSNLDSALNGKQPRRNDALAKKLLAQEEAARTTQVEGLLRASDWCARRGFVTAATVAISEVLRRRAAATPDSQIEERLKKLIPAGFPFKDRMDAVKQWTIWAEALLPSSAEFLEPGDAAWGRLDTPPWKDGGALGFRTRNLLLFCKDKGPDVGGRVLQLGEGTVRAVQVLLNGGEREAVAGDGDRLEVRIHKDRAAYLAEQSKTGKPPEWSAGFFSPADKISRFYVERSTSGMTSTADLDELGRVLTHELTHHYMQVRWMSMSQARGPGHWVIEGMATFVEAQAVQMDRRGLAFSDETVPNLDAFSQAFRKGSYFPAGQFVDGNYADFGALSDATDVAIRLRNSSGQKIYTRRGLWYDQAGALCFFFLHKRGAEGREEFVQYVKLHYMGRAPAEGWKKLGFETPEDLDREFGAFLKKLAGG